MFIQFRNENQCMLNFPQVRYKIEPETLELLQLSCKSKVFLCFFNTLPVKEGESLTVPCLSLLVDAVITPSGFPEHVC